MEAECLIIALALKYKYLAPIVRRLKLQVTDTFETAATDGRTIYVNKAWFESLTQEEQIGVGMHEVMHCLEKHAFRQRDRDPDLWNIAGDIEINTALVKNNFTLPAGALIHADYAFEGACAIKLPPDALTAEEIYDYLEKHPKLVSVSPGDLLLKAFGELPPEEKEKVRELIDEALKEVAIKDYGELPGWMEELIKPFKTPKLPWRYLLRHFVSNIRVDADLEFSMRPRRRQVPPLLIPAYQPKSYPKTAVIIDTSMSISTRELQQFFAEIDAIASASSVTLIYCDAKVQGVEPYKPGQKEIRVKGRGGTDMREGIQYAREKLEADVTILLTDGYTPWPSAWKPNEIVVLSSKSVNEEDVKPKPKYLLKIQE